MRRALLAAALLPLAGAASAQTAPLGPAGSAIGSVSVAPAAPGFTNQQASVVPQTTIANPGGLSLGGTARGAFPSISSQTGGIQNAGGLTFGSGLSLGSLPTPTSTTLSIGATGSFGLSSLGLGATSFGTTNRFGLSTGTVSAGIGATGSTTTSSTGGGFGSGAGISTGTTVDPTRQTGVRATGGGGGGGGAGISGGAASAANEACATLPVGGCTGAF